LLSCEINGQNALCFSGWGDEDYRVSSDERQAVACCLFSVFNFFRVVEDHVDVDVECEQSSDELFAGF